MLAVSSLIAYQRTVDITEYGGFVVESLPILFGTKIYILRNAANRKYLIFADQMIDHAADVDLIQSAVLDVIIGCDESMAAHELIATNAEQVADDLLLHDVGDYVPAIDFHVALVGRSAEIWMVYQAINEQPIARQQRFMRKQAIAVPDKEAACDAS